MSRFRPAASVSLLLALVAASLSGCAERNLDRDSPTLPTVPPPPEQAYANCVAPVYASDRLVCSDPELLALDQRLRETLEARRIQDPEHSADLWEQQVLWFRQRSLCAFEQEHASCLRHAYARRIQALGATPDAPRD